MEIIGAVDRVVQDLENQGQYKLKGFCYSGSKYSPISVYQYGKEIKPVSVSRFSRPDIDPEIDKCGFEITINKPLIDVHIQSGNQRLKLGANIVSGYKNNREVINPSERLNLTPIFLVTPGRTGSTTFFDRMRRNESIFLPGGYPFEDRHILYWSNLFSKATSDSSDKARDRDDIAFGKFVIHNPYISQDSNSVNAIGRELFIQTVNEYFDVIGRNDKALFYLEKGHLPVKYFKSLGILNYRLIYLIRNPLDILASTIRFNKKRGSYSFGWKAGMTTEDYIEIISETYKQMLLNYISSREKFSHAGSKSDVFGVRYEDVVNQNKTLEQELSTWLNTEIHLDQYTNMSQHITSQSSLNAGSTYSDVLSEKHIAMLESELKDLLIKVGYA